MSEEEFLRVADEMVVAHRCQEHGMSCSCGLTSPSKDRHWWHEYHVFHEFFQAGALHHESSSL